MSKKHLLASLLLAASIPTWAQTNNPSTGDGNLTSRDMSLLIHGVVLDRNGFNYRLQVALQNGQKDSPELQQAIQEDMYNRALLLEEAKRRGYTKDTTLKLLAQEAQENFYINLTLEEYLKNVPITEEMLQTEYERQVKQLGPKGTIVEYHLNAIIVNDEALANELVQRVKKENFTKLANSYSQDASSAHGGDLGWVNQTQLHPAIKPAIMNMNKGSVTAQPIQIGNFWHIIRLTDRREGKPATFETSKDRLKQSVTQNLRNEFIQSLRKTKDISR